MSSPILLQILKSAVEFMEKVTWESIGSMDRAEAWNHVYINLRKIFEYQTDIWKMMQECKYINLEKFQDLLIDSWARSLESIFYSQVYKKELDLKSFEKSMTAIKMKQYENILNLDSLLFHIGKIYPLDLNLVTLPWIFLVNILVIKEHKESAVTPKKL